MSVRALAAAALLALAAVPVSAQTSKRELDTLRALLELPAQVKLAPATELTLPPARPLRARLAFGLGYAWGTGEVHQSLYENHRDRSIITFAWRPDASAVVGVANPELRGNVQIYTYSPGATRGEVEAFSVTFNAADEDGLAFFTA